MPAGFYDENGDGRDELYFSISSYFRLGTRRMYYFDLANRSLQFKSVLWEYMPNILKLPMLMMTVVLKYSDQCQPPVIIKRMFPIQTAAHG